MQESVDGVVKGVILCIACFRGLHEVSTHRQDQANLINSGHENKIDEEEENNIHEDSS